MGIGITVQDAAIVRRIRIVQSLTIAWMTLEAGISLYAAWKARSPALLAFGGDSAIEWSSAVVVLGAFREDWWKIPEKLAAKTAAFLLYGLAVYVVGVSALTLAGRNEAQATYLGIAVLMAAAVLMPLLAREKRRLSVLSGSPALRGDAAQSAVCAYLSVIALFGVVLNGVFGIRWADPLAALAAVPIIVKEGRAVLRRDTCGCC